MGAEGIGNRGGLDFGLVAGGSTPFGTNEFSLNAVDIRLSLSSPVADMSCVTNGSYVEFGSDYLYVPVPEPNTWMTAAMAFASIAASKRRLGRAAKR